MDSTNETPSTVTVSEIATRHLRRLKQSASDYLGKEVNAAVVTIPSDFSDEQKTALESAAKSAGLEVLQFIPEPVSALLAHDAKVQQNACWSRRATRRLSLAFGNLAPAADWRPSAAHMTFAPTGLPLVMLACWIEESIETPLLLRLYTTE